MIKKLLCTLPNASSNINGIEFEPYELGGMVSVYSVDKLDQSAVNRFLKVGGYKLIDVDSKPTGDDSLDQKHVDDGDNDESKHAAGEAELINKQRRKSGRSKDEVSTNE
ncbi:hypothetical protein [Nitrosomonas sp.]|uniref:hypothetical protein n=1 Tax=Nitrosomonas sp. TaxID=42353 RepID=UPI00262522A6|nr:hypothetical protein [Nitrosomonas sp.]MCW5602602.1 hypothetical protein [Nitrosomonas sp.]